MTVIISGRRGGRDPAGPARVSPGDRRSPLTRRDRARSSRAQSTHPTRSFAFRRSVDNSGLPDLVFHVGRRTHNAHGRASTSQKPRLDCVALGRRINGRLVLFFGGRGAFIASPSLPVEPSQPLLLPDRRGHVRRTA